MMKFIIKASESEEVDRFPSFPEPAFNSISDGRHLNIHPFKGLTRIKSFLEQIDPNEGQQEESKNDSEEEEMPKLLPRPVKAISIQPIQNQFEGSPLNVNLLFQS